jgi:hypothetical protein
VKAGKAVHQFQQEPEEKEFSDMQSAYCSSLTFQARWGWICRMQDVSESGLSLAKAKTIISTYGAQRMEDFADE